VNEIARTPKYRAPTNEKIIEMVLKEVRERRLTPYIDRSSISVETTFSPVPRSWVSISTYHPRCRALNESRKPLHSFWGIIVVDIDITAP
jgi:hypothetical protein